MPKQSNNHIVSIRFEQESFDTLNRISDELNLDRSATIRAILDNFYTNKLTNPSSGFEERLADIEKKISFQNEKFLHIYSVHKELLAHVICLESDSFWSDPERQKYKKNVGASIDKHLKDLFEKEA
jgi:hypothetical protein